MRNIRHEVVIWVNIGIFLAIWVIILQLSQAGLMINWESLKTIPEVVTVYSVLYLLFTLWAWRLPIFRGWLVPFPDLEGTWQGESQSTWRDPNSGNALEPIPVTVSIRQTFTSIRVALFTEESTSYSTAASLSEEDDSGLKRLSYTYTNTPRVGVRDRSIVHGGAAILRIVDKPNRRLEGEYWTNRKSTGELVLQYKSKELAERFLPARAPDLDTK